MIFYTNTKVVSPKYTLCVRDTILSISLKYNTKHITWVSDYLNSVSSHSLSAWVAYKC